MHTECSAPGAEDLGVFVMVKGTGALSSPPAKVYGRLKVAGGGGAVCAQG